MLIKRITQIALAAAVAFGGIQFATPTMANEGGFAPSFEQPTAKKKKTSRQRIDEQRAKDAAKKKAKKAAKKAARKAKKEAGYRKRLKNAKKQLAFYEKQGKNLKLARDSKTWTKGSDVRRYEEKVKSTKREIKHAKRIIRDMEKKLGIKRPIRGVVIIK